jgi:hypothetical protein
MLKDTKATDRDRSIIAGHYVFANHEVAKVKEEAVNKLAVKGIDLDAYLKDQIKQSIMRYLYNFRLGAVI